jgi:guanylate kinase
LWLSRSWTTRERRADEHDSAYTFVDRDTFLTRVEDDGFLEHADFNGNLYGTPWPDPPADQDVVLEIEVQGARQVRRRDPDALLVMLVAPSPDAYRERMRARGDDEEHVRRRLELGASEEAEGRQIADAVVVNDDLGRAVAEVAGIVNAHRAALRARLDP